MVYGTFGPGSKPGMVVAEPVIQAVTETQCLSSPPWVGVECSGGTAGHGQTAGGWPEKTLSASAARVQLSLVEARGELASTVRTGAGRWRRKRCIKSKEGIS